MNPRLPPPLLQAARGAGFGLVTASLLAAYAARAKMLPEGDQDPLRDRWTRRWSDALLKLFNVEVTWIGQPPRRPELEGPPVGRLVVANHRSTIDIGILLGAFGGHMVSRADVSGWPIVGPAARLTGTVFVDRGNVRSGAAALLEIRDLLRRGSTVNLFPEGTTFAGDIVRPFHAAAFAAALRTSALIVPVGIAYANDRDAHFVNETFVAHLGRMARTPCTRVTVAVGPALPTQGHRANELAQAAHDAVQTLVNSARAHASGRT